MNFFTAVVVVFLTFVNENEIRAEELPGVCSGFPKDVPLTVECKCDSGTKDLEFQHEQLKDKFRNTNMFIVSNCSGSVEFTRDAFKELHKLENLEIRDVNHVVMEPGVFEHLDHLKISNVQDLEFKTSAFQGAHLKSVRIYESNIKKLPRFAFYNIETIEKFDLLQVNIDEVKSKAISLKNTTAVHISNTTMKQIAAQGIVIDAKDIVLYQSVLKGLKDGAVNLTAKSQLVLSQIEFDFDFVSSPFISNAPVVNISNNHFNFLTKDILRHMSGLSNGSILFFNNIIDKFESDKPLKEPPSNWDIRGNQFQCTCELLETFKNVRDSPLMENNFCKSNCMFSLNYAEEKCSKNPPANLDDQDICMGYTTIRPMTTTQRNREGKVLHLSNTNTTDNGNSGTAVTLGPLFWAIVTLRFLFSIL
ncbi:hypothetical protein C0J52_04814 [Blattella germanica]|nr:hypothetical protein C0J52_04814 [Blattella germanica]